jgi:hypothetical protein
MPRFFLMLIRILLSAWVGGAALFVITSIAEQRSPDFNSIIRDQLATIRFPLYYLFAVLTLAPATLLLLFLSLFKSTRSMKSVILAIVLALASTSVAVADYVTVYRPLQEMITPPGNVRNQRFITLHEWSRHINEVHVSLAIAAALVTCGIRLPGGSVGSRASS